MASSEAVSASTSPLRRPAKAARSVLPQGPEGCGRRRVRGHKAEDRVAACQSGKFEIAVSETALGQRRSSRSPSPRVMVVVS